MLATPLILAASLVQFAAWLLIISIVTTVVGWAIWAALNVVNKRREIAERREELASDVLRSMRNKAADAPPVVKKPLVYLPETIAEETEKADAPNNPWLSMLIRPGSTIRQIVDFDPQLYVLVLSCLYGVNGLLGTLIVNPRFHWRYEVLVPFVLVAGPLYGLIGVSLLSWAVRIGARYMGGEASEHETQAAIAWSALPQIYITPLTVAAAMLIFIDPRAPLTSSARAILIAAFAAAIVARLWTFVLWLYSLSEVNQFSLGKAFGALVLSAVIFLFVAIAIAIPFVATYFVLGLSPPMFIIAFAIVAAGIFVYTKLAAA